MKKSQLNAISYAKTQKKRKEVERLMDEIKKEGFRLVKISPYPEVNIKRCKKILEKIKSINKAITQYEKDINYLKGKVIYEQNIRN